jgi:macrolide-specific efflux system membrane fusion protein
MDPVGAVSQGVVSYDVKISFDAQNAQVKSGMTVNANIQTGVHQNVLTVPSGAIKTAGTQSYVLAFVPPIATSTSAASSAQTAQGITTDQVPQQIAVQVGLSDDTNTEITSGLTDGQQIVVRTTTGAPTAATASRPGAGAAAGGAARGFGGGGGGAIRIGG